MCGGACVVQVVFERFKKGEHLLIRPLRTRNGGPAFEIFSRGTYEIPAVHRGRSAENFSSSNVAGMCFTQHGGIFPDCRVGWVRAGECAPIDEVIRSFGECSRFKERDPSGGILAEPSREGNASRTRADHHRVCDHGYCFTENTVSAVRNDASMRSRRSDVSSASSHR